MPAVGRGGSQSCCWPSLTPGMTSAAGSRHSTAIAPSLRMAAVCTDSTSSTVRSAGPGASRHRAVARSRRLFRGSWMATASPPRTQPSTNWLAGLPGSLTASSSAVAVPLLSCMPCWGHRRSSRPLRSLIATLSRSTVPPASWWESSVDLPARQQNGLAASLLIVDCVMVPGSIL